MLNENHCISNTSYNSDVNKMNNHLMISFLIVSAVKHKIKTPNIMSTQLKTLKGKIEVPHYSETIVVSRDVNLTVFDGGEFRGKCLQIGFKNPMHEYVHIQLDNDTVKELIEILQENFNN